jgi:5-carboxyvanillate decarboxylase
MNDHRLDMPPARAYRRIATEEAYAPPELIQAYRRLIDGGHSDDPGFTSSWRYFLNNPSPRTQSIIAKLQDLGEGLFRK